MTDALYAVRPAGPVRGVVRPPGSKSITNRALVCAALADGRSLLHGALDSDDTRVMIESLGRLGVRVEPCGPDSLRVEGCGGRWPAGSFELDAANSGTTIRFLAAALAAGPGRYRLDGTPRMRRRPIGDLLVALRQLGAAAGCEAEEGFPPVVVGGQALRGGRADVAGAISSQFLSGLLMAAPQAERDVELHVRGPLVSQPYVRMTLGVMNAFGAAVETDERLNTFRVPAGQRYQPQTYAIEPDASAASYFWAAAAITGGDVTVAGLRRQALQGDVQFCDVLEQMGCSVDESPAGIRVRGPARLRGVAVDMNAISDTVQTLAAVALFAEGATTITGVAHIRHKESDRIGDLARELRKLGAGVEELPDGLRITPGRRRGARIATYDDHRMAMSLALAGLRTPGVVIENPACTAKTYPRFFDDLERLCGR